MAECLGDSPGHCCWIGGKACGFLRDDGPGASRRWVCVLRERLGSWEVVHSDLRYLRIVKPRLEHLDLPDCGDWPRPGEKCEECGVIG